MTTLLVILGIAAAIIVYGIVLYNNLVSLRNRVKNGFSQIDVQLTRRHDLIPSLVEAVKGYMSHERETLEAVISARNSAISAPDTPPAQAAADNVLSGALRQLFALGEAYPDLKANQNFLELQSQLEGTENRIAVERRRFN